MRMRSGRRRRWVPRRGSRRRWITKEGTFSLQSSAAMEAHSMQYQRRDVRLTKARRCLCRRDLPKVAARMAAGRAVGRGAPERVPATGDEEAHSEGWVRSGISRHYAGQACGEGRAVRYGRVSRLLGLQKWSGKWRAIGASTEAARAGGCSHVTKHQNASCVASIVASGGANNAEIESGYARSQVCFFCIYGHGVVVGWYAGGQSHAVVTRQSRRAHWVGASCPYPIDYSAALADLVLP